MESAQSFTDELIKKVSEFLTSIGIEVIPYQFGDDTFLPGIMVDKGRLLVDESRLSHPLDLLHEAGHLAVAPSSIRKTLCGEVVLPGVDMDMVEAKAIAWSYAATLHLDLDPAELFHADGYKGRSSNLLNTFLLGVYPGLNGLEEDGLAASERRAGQLNVAPYPKMIKWLRN